MKLKPTLIAAAISALVISGCDRGAPEAAQQNAASVTAESKSIQDSTAKVSQEAIKQVNQMFEDFFQEHLSRSPEFKTFLGKKEDYDKWDNLSPEFAKETLEINKRQLDELNKVDPNTLDEATRLSLRLAKRNLEQDIEGYKWRNHHYPVNQMYATHTSAASLLISQHRIDKVSDAEAYIARLNGMPQYFAQLEENLKANAKAGTIVPKFVFPYVISDSQNLISGAPFEGEKDSPLFADFKGKVEKLEISAEQKKALIDKASTALQESAGPAYKKLISYLQELEKKATTDDGAWKLANGDDFYKFRLGVYTTTDMTADEIHQTGLKEVARIHDEMREIMRKVKFEGNLQEFFEFMRTDKQFYYPTSEEGKAEYLEKATAIIDTMKGRLDELFITKPKADLDVRAVEPFREKSAGKAFYQRPAPDGSRPGIYYANLYNMEDMPTYQMEALAYHEGIPGHHMQLSIAQELQDIPKFRKYGGYTAYTEGWGLYSELVPKELGFYEDPYSDFGRLAMELWRAGRLVVDTGLHAKKWTREQAIDYLVENTPNPKGDVVKAIERYIVMPGQATAYKIGMLKIIELREKAKAELGDKFDVRGFHDTILANGAVPLNVLEELVDGWVASVKAKS
ncbi:DUF885 domain-containing protein [Microbulbifer variabilis]|uniref:DUF885 domain-containing protein n=1 Tax=Microbulbifer variabilis TaxID=266805 RepID=A0ABY4VEG5_9GAMM|nr:DUF885 domain-containing protein [Microbulbifer variabilis]USD22678.1 DUF885 domain-containing protein [Microbulbifer variabilis]